MTVYIPAAWSSFITYKKEGEDSGTFSVRGSHAPEVGDFFALIYLHGVNGKVSTYQLPIIIQPSSTAEDQDSQEESATQQPSSSDQSQLPSVAPEKDEEDPPHDESESAVADASPFSYFSLAGRIAEDPGALSDLIDDQREHIQKLTQNEKGLRQPEIRLSDATT